VIDFMKKSVFEYTDYKKYINDRIDNSPSRGRGIKLAMAKHLSCQTAYISQVLRKDPNFNLEQAIKLNRFWEHNKAEGRFFLLMIQYARAGTRELEEYFVDLMEEIVEKRHNLKERLDIEDSLDDINQHIYYSVWYYAAIHILISIPEYQTPQAISERLKLPIEKVQDVLEFLQKTGLAVQEGVGYTIGKTRIHLAKDSIQVLRHHNNWRSRAVIAIDRNMNDDFHYSNVLSMSHKDIPRIREILIKAIEDCRAIIRESNEEELLIWNMDLFQL
jgi:uncharacterized protein (TIGR02147 family)